MAQPKPNGSRLTTVRATRFDKTGADTLTECWWTNFVLRWATGLTDRQQKLSRRGGCGQVDSSIRRSNRPRLPWKTRCVARCACLCPLPKALDHNGQEEPDSTGRDENERYKERTAGPLAAARRAAPQPVPAARGQARGPVVRQIRRPRHHEPEQSNAERLFGRPRLTGLHGIRLFLNETTVSQRSRRHVISWAHQPWPSRHIKLRP